MRTGGGADIGLVPALNELALALGILLLLGDFYSNRRLWLNALSSGKIR